MFRRILTELREHAPFTAFGAITGIMIMVIIVLGNVPSQVSRVVFLVLHPMHVILSAMVTTAMYRRYSRGESKMWAAFIIGYCGSVGIATISDTIIPYLEGTSLSLGIEFIKSFSKSSDMQIIDRNISHRQSSHKKLGLLNGIHATDL